jgi:6-pyruvoyltetrahydropterin/6-carboxytetrahydropterin synthase
MGPLQTSVTCTFTFEAAHLLEWHTGRCRNLHGHSYRLDVTVAGPLDANGVVVDFDELSAVVHREVIDRWDHRYLNDLVDNPTAEVLARGAWELLASAGLRPAAVRLWETPTCWVDVVAGPEG